MFNTANNKQFHSHLQYLFTSYILKKIVTKTTERMRSGKCAEEIKHKIKLNNNNK